MPRQSIDPACVRELGILLRPFSLTPGTPPTPPAMAELEASLKGLVQFVDRHGWPLKGLVGSLLSSNCMQLVLRADLGFQRQCLPLLRAAVQSREAEPQDLAQLEDAISVQEGRLQTYGTWAPSGILEARQVEDPERLNERRRLVGLDPIDLLLRQDEASLLSMKPVRVLAHRATADGGFKFAPNLKPQPWLFGLDFTYNGLSSQTYTRLCFVPSSRGYVYRPRTIRVPR